MSGHPTPKKVLVLIGDTGGGHRSAALAISEGFRRSHGEKFRVSVADVLGALPPPLCLAGWAYGPLIRRAPQLWRLIFSASDGLRRMETAEDLLYPAARGAVRALFARERPDLILSAHPLANHVAARLRSEDGLGAALATLVTDPVTVHPAWVCPDVDLMLVVTERAARQAEALGMPRGRIEVAGLPVDPRLGDPAPADRGALRRRWGLPQEGPVALLAGGMDGAGRLGEIAEALERAAVPAGLAVATGRNAKLRRRLERRRWRIPVRALGLIDDMPDLMRVCDVVLTKAGPAMLWEAMAAGLPIVITHQVPGQEAGNVELLAEAGAARPIFDPTELAASLGDWLRDGNRTLEEMAERSRAMGRPGAALEIADRLGRLAP